MLVNAATKAIPARDDFSRGERCDLDASGTVGVADRRMIKTTEERKWRRSSRESRHIQEGARSGIEGMGCVQEEVIHTELSAIEAKSKISGCADVGHVPAATIETTHTNSSRVQYPRTVRTQPLELAKPRRFPSR